MNVERFNDLALMNFSSTKVLKAFIDKNPRKIEIDIFNRFKVHL